MESSAFIVGHQWNLTIFFFYISPYPHGRLINVIYFIAQKMFLLNILEAVLAYDLVKIRFIKENEVILNDKSRGIQLIGPGYLQKVIKGVN